MKAYIDWQEWYPVRVPVPADSEVRPRPGGPGSGFPGDPVYDVPDSLMLRYTMAKERFIAVCAELAEIEDASS